MSGIFCFNQYVKVLPICLVVVNLLACANNDTSSSSPTSSVKLFQSAKNTSLSHNVGMNCLDASCHSQPASSSRPHFTLAGTVYTDANATNIYPNVDVELIVNGSVAKDIPVDNLGNFYTTGPIAWNDYPQPQVRTGSGSYKMTPHLSSASNGGCAQSACHEINGIQGSVYGP